MRADNAVNLFIIHPLFCFFSGRGLVEAPCLSLKVSSEIGCPAVNKHDSPYILSCGKENEMQTTTLLVISHRA